MKHAHGAMRRNSHAIEREKSPRVSKVKSLSTREFAVTGLCRRDGAMGIAQGPFIIPAGRFGRRGTGPAAPSAVGSLCRFSTKTIN